MADIPLTRPDLVTDAVPNVTSGATAAINEAGTSILEVYDYIGTGATPAEGTLRARLAATESTLASLLTDPMPTSIDWLAQRRQEAHVPFVNQFFPNVGGRMDSVAGLSARPAASARTPVALDGNGGLTVPLGCRWIVQGIDVWGDQPYQGYFRINEITRIMDPNGAAVGYDREYGPIAGLANQMVSLDLGNAQLAEYAELIPFLVPAAGVTSLPFMGFAPRLIQVTNDPRWNAKHTIIGMGNSTSWTIPGNYDGSNGSVDVRHTAAHPRGEHLALFRERDALRALGVDVRLVNLSFGASTAAAFAGFLRQGRWDGMRGDLFHIDTCLNDPGGTIGDRDASRALYAEIGRWIQRNNPGATIVLHQMGPTDTGSRAAKRVNLRDAVVGAAADLGGAPKNVYICDLRNAFDSVGGDTSTNAFANTETAGNRVHGNVLGHQLYTAAMLNTVETTNFYRSRLDLSNSLSPVPVAS